MDRWGVWGRNDCPRKALRKLRRLREAGDWRHYKEGRTLTDLTGALLTWQQSASERFLKTLDPIYLALVEECRAFHTEVGTHRGKKRETKLKLLMCSHCGEHPATGGSGLCDRCRNRTRNS
jgi:hypothetical protein